MCKVNQHMAGQGRAEKEMSHLQDRLQLLQNVHAALRLWDAVCLHACHTITLSTIQAQ